MPIPPAKIIERLGPATLPGHRTNRADIVSQGEDIPFTDFLYNATDNGEPPDVVIADDLSDLREAKRYLWLITSAGLFMLKESTPNPLSRRGHVCHTNFFGSVEALQGGELWFIGPSSIAINGRSGRYGSATVEQWAAVKEYFSIAGYQNIVDLDALPN